MDSRHFHLTPLPKVALKPPEREETGTVKHSQRIRLNCGVRWTLSSLPAVRFVDKPRNSVPRVPVVRTRAMAHTIWVRLVARVRTFAHELSVAVRP